jgi:ribose transport system permease protein
MSSGPASGTSPTAPVRAPASGRLWRFARNYGLLIAFAAAILLFSSLKPQYFPTFQNAGSIMTGGAPLVLMALAIMLPLIVNQFDLTPGFMGMLAALLVIGLQSFNHWSPWPAIVLALVVCGMIGLLSGLLVARAGLSSLIVTLAVGAAIYGVGQIYSAGQRIFQNIGTDFTMLGQGHFLGFPLPFVYAFLVASVLWYILEFRPLGRSLYAIGSNSEGARLIGIPIARLTVLMFVGSALLAGLAGTVQASSVGSAGPTGIQDLLLPAFTAAFLGATSIRPGQYNVWGTVIAVYLVGASTTGMFMLGAPASISQLFNGSILLIAVVLAKVSARRVAEA